MRARLGRGFFRLWVACSILWIGTTGYLNSDALGLTEPSWKAAPAVHSITVNGPGGITVGFSEGHSKASIERAMVKAMALPTPPPGFVIDGDPLTLTEAQQAAINSARQRRQTHAIASTFGPPAAALLLGFAVVWIARGFAPKTKRRDA